MESQHRIRKPAVIWANFADWFQNDLPVLPIITVILAKPDYAAIHERKDPCKSKIDFEP